jgi:ABC-type multidrug transport system ATPase subunit
MPLLSLSHITFAYEKGHNTIEDISFELHHGEILGLTGGNGTGKSTLLKIMSGFITGYTGELYVSEEAAEHIACVIDKPSIFEEMSVKNNLEMMKKLSHGTKAVDEELLEIMNLYPYMKTRASHLSLGNKQKLALCLAVNKETCIAILDEPFNGLDTFTKTDLITYLKKRASEGMGIIVTSHIPGDIDEICDKVVEIR